MCGAGLGGMMAIGLDYGGVRAGLELSGIEATPELFTQIRTIEYGARAELNRSRS